MTPREQDARSKRIDLEYPEVGTNDKFVLVGLMDVRAADDIRISYDFDRDGWKIEQASIFGWDAGDKIQDMDWQEVAFVQAWGRDKTE
jgi:hypothetical protein